VPIIVAIFPLVAGVPAGERIFQVVFFAVLVSVTFQGASAGRLRLEGPRTPFPPAAVEISSNRPTTGDVKKVKKGFGALRFGVHR
jgi:cell volume regulation protein A